MPSPSISYLCLPVLSNSAPATRSLAPVTRPEVFLNKLRSHRSLTINPTTTVLLTVATSSVSSVTSISGAVAPKGASASDTNLSCDAEDA